MTVALMGNPNVGKSTLFNTLTGMHQHTGNWAGKTVDTAVGSYTYRAEEYTLVDLPGTYSLHPRSAEEAIARDYLLSGAPDVAVVVCDAACLERNLGLVLQTLETGLPTVVCVNLLDEAARRGVRPDLAALEAALGVPVVGTVARRRRTVTALAAAVATAPAPPPAPLVYPLAVEAALIAADTPCRAEALARIGHRDEVAETVMARAREIAAATVSTPAGYDRTDRAVDRILTGRAVGYPLMILLLCGVLWLTVEGANVPSRWLSFGLFWLGDRMREGLTALAAPPWLVGALIDGAWRTLAWVVSVMLPPMAIFFPLFTLLEDVGYLPRIAYNLDRPLARCHACGKQALTMCMGFGCNAAGVVGCRIIDSPRERLLAILTNAFVPCNGRFPTLITLITLFFVGGVSGLPAALILTAVILLGVGATLGMTRLLSATLLRGEPSAYTLELPPYRRPQVGAILWRAVCDRTLFVLGRAAAVAAPVGLVLWVTAHIPVGDGSLLAAVAAWLDPVGRAMGMDGAILMGFVFGLPANEIVLPVTLMIYLATGMLTDMSDPAALAAVLGGAGWTAKTAVCVVLFSLFHWPCSTTLLTIRKETGSAKWTALAALLPTVLGVALCVLVNAVWR